MRLRHVHLLDNQITHRAQGQVRRRWTRHTTGASTESTSNTRGQRVGWGGVEETPPEERRPHKRSDDTSTAWLRADSSSLRPC